MPARSPSRTRTRKTIGLVAAAALAAAGLATAATAGTAHAATAPLTANWYESAPYYYTLDSAAPDLGQVISDTGQKAFLLAFILADGGCTPSWDGTDPVSSDTQVAAVVNEVRADGGDVGASEGGATGNKLGQECSTPAATAAAYQSVITKYSLHYFDFDIEEPEIESSSAVANEIGAAQILQAEDPGLLISITIPTATTGANYFGQLVLDQASSDGFVPDDWSLMPFDNGFTGGAASQQTALTDFHSQLVSTFGWSSAVAWNHEGISQMNGQSDTGEIFEPADFASNLAFAEANNLSRFTFWDENRDRECDPVNEATNGDCSSVAQTAYEYTGYDASFAKWAPTTAPAAPPEPACVSTTFSASTVYTQGDEVYYDGANWTANYWTEGGTPPTDSGAWKDDGPCGGTSTSTSASATPSPSATSASPTPTPTASTSPSSTATSTPTGTTTSTPPSSGSLVNGDFSTGSLSPWVCDSGTGQIATSPTYDSSYALEGTPTSSDDAQCEQTITVAADTSYTLSGYVDGDYVYLGVSGAATTDTWTASTSGYQQLSVSFTTGSSTSLTVYVHGWYAEGTYYADDLSLT